MLLFKFVFQLSFSTYCVCPHYSFRDVPLPIFFCLAQQSSRLLPDGLGFSFHYSLLSIPKRLLLDSMALSSFFQKFCLRLNPRFCLSIGLPFLTTIQVQLSSVFWTTCSWPYCSWRRRQHMKRQGFHFEPARKGWRQEYCNQDASLLCQW